MLPVRDVLDLADEEKEVEARPVSSTEEQVEQSHLLAIVTSCIDPLIEHVISR